MRILEIIPGSEEESKASARAVLQDELNDPVKTLVIIRGITSELEALAKRADERCESIPWRETVWVKNEDIFTEEQKSELFEGKSIEECCGIVRNNSNQQQKVLLPNTESWEIDDILTGIRGD